MPDKAAKQATPPKKGPLKSLFYRGVRLTARIAGVFLFDLRCYGRENTLIPGGALILSTHQSHFDPVLIGVTFNEHLNYLARRTLFDHWLLALIIRLLDAIELDRDRSGLAGLKETMKRLKRGDKVLIFPEGTRSNDGQIAELKPGFISVARRCKVPLIPVAITGAFEALPRGSKIPLRYPIHVSVGKVISFEEFEQIEDNELLTLVQKRLDGCFETANGTRRI